MSDEMMPKTYFSQAYGVEIKESILATQNQYPMKRYRVWAKNSQTGLCYHSEAHSDEQLETFLKAHSGYEWSAGFSAVK